MNTGILQGGNFLSWFTDAARERSKYQKKILIIGSAQDAGKLSRHCALQHDQDYVIETFLSGRAVSNTQVNLPSGLQAFVKDKDIDFIIVGEERISKGLLLDGLLECKIEGVPVMDVESFLALRG